MKRECPNCKAEIIYKTMSGFVRANENLTLCKPCSSLKQYKNRRPVPSREPLYCKNCGIEFKRKRSCKFCSSECSRKFWLLTHPEYRQISIPKRYSRTCPSCSDTIIYKRHFPYRLAVERNYVCEKCSKENLKRTCECGKVITYSSLRDKMGAESNGSKCKSCAAKGKYSFNRKREYSGITGYYNGTLFRSSYELKYIIEVLERDSKIWKSAEKIRIEYEFNGQTRMYKPDFLVDEKFLVEIKPLCMQSHPMNIAKRLAAEKYCEENQLIYSMEDHGFYSQEEMLEMHKSGKIKLLKSYLDKYLI